MKIYNYFHASLASAQNIPNAPDRYVWYLLPGQQSVLRTNQTTPPTGAVYVIIAAEGQQLAGAVYIGGGTKDPLPPPPPPPPPPAFTIGGYLSSQTWSDFVAALPRGVGETNAFDGFALIVQITAYPTMPLPDVSDADDIAAVLSDPELCGYPAKNVRVVKDELATRDGLRAELSALVEAAGETATVAFYFSGHGGQWNGDTYLIPFDANRADIAGTAISAAELADAFRRLRAKRALLMFDCCHSGALQARDAELPVVPGLDGAARATLIGGRDWALLAASDAGESSYVKHGERNGIFTKHLLAGMRGGVASPDGDISIYDLYEYVYERVNNEQRRQNPRLKCDIGGAFSVARYRGGLATNKSPSRDPYKFDVLLSCATADETFVDSKLFTQLKESGLRVATSNSEVVGPGMDRVLSVEEGIKQVRRTLVVLSSAYVQRERIQDKHTDFGVLLAKHADIESGRYSIVPVYIEDEETVSRELPAWLRALSGVRLGGALRRFDSESQNMAMLIRALKKGTALEQSGA